jgi:lipopolysaccharide transport system permease protein
MSTESPGSISGDPPRTGFPLSAEVTRARRSEWIENRPSRGWLPRFDLSELLAYRELALLLALRDLKLRYKQTFFGVAWAIIQPLAGVAIFSVVFGHLAKVPSDGLPYPVFAYAGFAVWTYLSTSVTGAAESLAQQEALVTKIYFPRLLAPLAAVLPGLVDLAVSLLVLAVFMAAYTVAPTAALILLPIWVIAAVSVAAAVGVVLSALNVEYRDVRYALPFLLQLWLFASPVVYPSSLFHGVWQYVYSVNPAVAVIDGFRWSLAGGPAPGPEALVSLAAWIVIMGVGLFYFGRVERRFADRI